VDLGCNGHVTVGNGHVTVVFAARALD
jgi:hypothetical protein